MCRPGVASRRLEWMVGVRKCRTADAGLRLDLGSKSTGASAAIRFSCILVCKNLHFGKRF